MTDTVSLTIRGLVRWADTDASGWIHFTAALRWAEEAEHGVYRSLGVEPGRFPRRSVDVEYHAPFRAGTPFIVYLELDRFGTTSLTWSWSIYSRDDDGVGPNTEKPAITGHFTAVHLGSEGRPAELPTELSVLRVKGDDS